MLTNGLSWVEIDGCDCALVARQLFDDIRHAYRN